MPNKEYIINHVDPKGNIHTSSLLPHVRIILLQVYTIKSPRQMLTLQYLCRLRISKDHPDNIVRTFPTWRLTVGDYR